MKNITAIVRIGAEESVRSQCLEAIQAEAAVSEVFWVSDEDQRITSAYMEAVSLAATDNDLLFVRDSTVLLEGAVGELQKQAYLESVGLTGPVYENLGHSTVLSTECFCPEIGAFFIRRALWNLVGGIEKDYRTDAFGIYELACKLKKAGYHSAFANMAYAFHYPVLYTGDYEAAEDDVTLFRESFHLDISYYVNPRLDMIPLIERAKDDPFSVLEIGCGCGTTLIKIKRSFQNVRIAGMELMENVASLAPQEANVICGNVETDELPVDKGSQDYILFGDVLEHLRDTEAALVHMKEYLKADGCIIASIPNVLHYSVLLGLMMGQFEYADFGILDRTHLRFFTLDSIIQMFDRCGYTIEECRVNERPPADEWAEVIEKLSEVDSRFKMERTKDFQYIVRARKKGEEK